MERHTPKGALSMRPAFRLWMEDGKKQIILDQTDAMLLRHVAGENSLTKAAQEVGISYRNAWDRIRAIEEALGRKLVNTKVGGKTGGSASLSAEGKELLREFRKTRKFLLNILDDREIWEDISYRLSARNRLPAKIVNLKRGTVTSEVKMRLLYQAQLTSIITNEAVDELSLNEDDEVEAIVKSTDVIIAKKEPPEA